MNLSPLLGAPVPVQWHAFAALAAFAIGVVQLARAKGDRAHRMLGYAWVSLMTAVALSSFLIHGINQWNGWSWIHLLSIYTLGALPIAIMHARTGRIDSHRTQMIWLFVGALVIAGIFTFMPGRIMHSVLFG